MNEVTVFNFNGVSDVRTININNEAWFVAKDILAILDISNITDAMSRLQDDEKLIRPDLTSLGQRGGWIINESGLYNLIIRSDKPEAKVFRKWITSEVLPAIRKTGGYLTEKATQEMIDDPFSKIIEIATECKRLALANKQMSNKIEVDAPKVDFAEKCLKSDSLVLIGQVAKLASDEGICIGRNRLFDKLKEWNMLMSSTEPYQRYIDMGLFKVVQCVKDGKMYMTTRATPKGQMFIINKLKKEFANKSIEFIVE